MLHNPLVSIVIPTYNETVVLDVLWHHLKSLQNAEFIFVDGGSTDSTAAGIRAIRDHRIRLVETTRSRAVQMNAGARHAQGQWIMFLHADTTLSSDAFGSFLDAIQNLPFLEAGAFTLRFDQRRLRYRYLEWFVGWRCRWFKLPLGDQAIFVRKDIWTASGGFDENLSFLEDMRFVEGLRSLRGFRILKAHVITSTRRHESDGYFKRITLNFIIQLLYKLGFHPNTLARLYGIRP